MDDPDEGRDRNCEVDAEGTEEMSVGLLPDAEERDEDRELEGGDKGETAT